MSRVSSQVLIEMHLAEDWKLFLGSVFTAYSVHSKSRSTIVAAYALLQKRGWVTSRHCSGTEVAQLFSYLRQQKLNPLSRVPLIDLYLSDPVRGN